MMAYRHRSRYDVALTDSVAAMSWLTDDGHGAKCASPKKSPAHGEAFTLPIVSQSALLACKVLGAT